MAAGVRQPQAAAMQGAELSFIAPDEGARYFDGAPHPDTACTRTICADDRGTHGT